LKLKCDEPPSNVACNFKLRRYTVATFCLLDRSRHRNDIGRAVQVDSIKTRVESAYGISA